MEKNERRRSYDADVDRIAKSIEYLSTATRELSTLQQTQIARIRRHAKFLTIIVAMCVVMLVALAIVAYRAEVNSDKIAALQEATSARVLCPIWRSYLNSYRPKSAIALEDPEAYEDFFLRIEEGARIIGCMQTTRKMR